MRNHEWFKIFGVAILGALVALAGCQSAPESGEADSAEASETAAAPGAAGSPAASKSRTAMLDAGTVLRVRTTTTLSTKSAANGESFDASLEEPLMAGDRMIAPKGATVKGVIVNSDPGGRVKGVASLSVRLTQLETAGGQMIDLATSTYATQAKSTKKKDATKIGIGSGIGAAVGAIAGGGKGAAVGAGVGAGAGTGAVLATKGDAAVIPNESVLSFTLREPVTVSVN